MIYVARQLGHDARLTLSTYGHVIDELDDQPRLSAEERSGAPEHLVYPWCSRRRPNARTAGTTEARDSALLRGLRAMELGGLEPPTSWVRSRRSPN